MNVLDARAMSVREIAHDVAAIVRKGGVVVMPTDTVYGIFCDPRETRAVERIYALKARPRDKPLGLHVADVERFLELAAGNIAAAKLARAFLPGPLTVIVARSASVDPSISAGLGTVGLRVPNHALHLAILAATGPLAGTSANLSGMPAFVGGPLPENFPDADAYVDDGAAPLGIESTVVDVSQERMQRVRLGAIPLADIEKVLGTALR